MAAPVVPAARCTSVEAPFPFLSELPAAFAWHEPARHHHQVHFHGQEGDQQAAQTEGEEERVEDGAEGSSAINYETDVFLKRELNHRSIVAFCSRGRCMF